MLRAPDSKKNLYCLISGRVNFLGLFVDYSDELAANSVDLFAVHSSPWLRDVADVVVIATQVREGRPPLFGPGGFRATAHVAGQVNPDGARGGRLIGTGLS